MDICLGCSARGVRTNSETTRTFHKLIQRQYCVSIRAKGVFNNYVKVTGADKLGVYVISILLSYSIIDLYKM